MSKEDLFFSYKKPRQLEFFNDYGSIRGAINATPIAPHLELFSKQLAKKHLLKNLQICACRNGLIIVHDEIDMFNLTYYLKNYKHADIRHKVEIPYCVVFMDDFAFGISVY